MDEKVEGQQQRWSRSMAELAWQQPMLRPRVLSELHRYSVSLSLVGDGLPMYEPHVLEPTPARRAGDQQQREAQQTTPATAGPKQMQEPTKSDAMHANHTVPLPDAVVAVMDDGHRGRCRAAGEAGGDGQMRPTHLVSVVVARDS